ncbi:MAG: trypsin-like serine protease, partial [Nitrospinaceae bacterium]|nr:trypsin-like serine protease [Nitrospinaceae bacterium]
MHLLFAAAVLAGFPPGSTLHADLAGSGRASVVKIFTSYQRANYTLPWQARNPSKGSGSGFVISGNRILTNAHLVADARFIQVQREGDSRQF